MLISGTVRLTGSIRGLFDGAADVMMIVPVYTPGTKVTGFMPTVNVAGVLEEAGLTDSQSPPPSVEAAAVTINPLLGVSLVIDSV